MHAVLEGRRIAPGVSRERKVRTPKGAMPRNLLTLNSRVIHAGGGQNLRRTVPQKINSRRREPAVMVKRCGKSAPREAQATRHGKPHRVQGQIGNRGAARSASAKADRFRVSAAETNDSLRRKAQTKFGLQPFQNHFQLLQVVRSTVAGHCGKILRHQYRRRAQISQPVHGVQADRFRI
jgi:hypothetical protein